MLKLIFTVALVIQSCCNAFSVQPTLDTRVTDGNDAQPGEFPYQVSLEWGIPPFIGYRHICGATLITDNYVVTAAHCILRVGKLRAVVGKHEMSVHDPTMEQMSEISVRFVHPDYKGGVAPYDIALLKLKTPVKFTEHVKAAMLPKQDEIHTGDAILTGWGSISKKFLPIMPKVLQVAKVPILEQNICTEAINGFSTEATLYDSQVCTGPLGSSISACSGDSGGPLVQYQNDTPVLVGIVSWGFYPCGSSGAPSVYTRVSSFVDWIRPKIEYF